MLRSRTNTAGGGDTLFIGIVLHILNAREKDHREHMYQEHSSTEKAIHEHKELDPSKGNLTREYIGSGSG